VGIFFFMNRYEWILLCRFATLHGYIQQTWNGQLVNYDGLVFFILFYFFLSHTSWISNSRYLLNGRVEQTKTALLQ